MFVCAQCKKELEDSLEFKIAPHRDIEKHECAFCNRSCYGDYYDVSYKNYRK